MLKLLGNILQNRTRLHHAVALVYLASKYRKGRKPTAGEDATFLNSVPACFRHGADDCPSKDIIAQVREVASALDKDLCYAVVDLDLSERSCYDDVRIGKSNLCQGPRHRSYIGIRYTLQNVLGLGPGLIECCLDIWVAGSPAGRPFEVHQVADVYGEDTDQLEDFIDRISIRPCQA
jgi:hypothetical protein